MSRNASASHRPRPRIACWRHGPGSPAASARIQPVLRGSFPSNPSKNFHADAATRSWRNKGRSCAFTSRSEHAQSSSVASIDAPAIHDPPNHGGPWIQKSKECATVMLSETWDRLNVWRLFEEGHVLVVNKSHPLAMQNGLSSLGQRLLDWDSDS